MGAQLTLAIKQCKGEGLEPRLWVWNDNCGMTNVHDVHTYTSFSVGPGSRS